MSSELPQGWRRLRLEAVLDRIIDHRGRTPKKLGGDFVDEGVQVISAKNVYDGRLHPEINRRFVTQSMAASWMPVPLAAGDVLLTSEAPLGEVAYLDGNPSYCLGQRLFALRARHDLDPRYLYFALQGPLMQRRLRGRATGTTAQGIRQAELRQLDIELPPLNEQRAIASVLRALDDKIESNRRLGRLAEEAVAHCCTRVARIDPDPAPGWTAVPFLEAVEINPRVRIAKGTDTPFIAMADVPAFGTRPDTIGRRPYSGGCKYEPGDTLMARITGCIEHGKGAFIDFVDEPGAGSTEFLVFRARDPLTPEVVFCLSRDQRLRSHAIASMTGTSGRQRVDNACFEALTVSIAPDGQEREAAVAFMRRAMEVSKAAWAEARTLAEIRDVLLPKLVSGQIRVPADAEEVAEGMAEPHGLMESPV